MTVGAVNSGGTLNSALTARGLSSDKARYFEDALVQTVTAAPVVGADGEVGGAEVRAKLDKQIADDVKSGKLSEQDATAIGKLLDETDEIDIVDDPDEAGASPSAPVAGVPDAGGGGGAAEKVELSRSVESAGAIKTTTIQYTDGTSETETRSSTDKNDKETTAPARAGSTARDWLATIEPGSLVNKFA